MDVMGVLADASRAAVGPEAVVFALAAIGLNLHYGYTGLLNLGQVGFMLLGAYGVAVTVSVFGGPLWLGLVVAGILATLLALLLGIPTLRLRSDYLAISTIAVAELLRLFVRAGFAEPVTGGVFGLTEFARGFYAFNPIPAGRYGIGRFGFDERRLWLLVVGWLLVVLATLLVRALVRSPWGRVVMAIREDEAVATSLGKPVFGYKLQSLVVGGVIGAAGGAVLVIGQQAVIPETFIAGVTFFAYTVLILGGRGQLLGPVVGSVVFWFVLALSDSALRQAIDVGYVPEGLIGTEEVGIVRFMIVGVGLMFLMVFRPQGILGRRAESRLERS
jgi:neutral amino acid transport system permease protein